VAFPLGCFWMNESGQFFVRLQFVPEPNAGTPRKRYRFAQQRSSGGGKTASEGEAVNCNS
jgi:hypothetical protein